MQTRNERLLWGLLIARGMVSADEVAERTEVTLSTVMKWQRHVLTTSTSIERMIAIQKGQSMVDEATIISMLLLEA